MIKDVLGLIKMTTKENKENLNPLLFDGFKNYNKQKEEINQAIQSLYMYLKMSGMVFYFEHCDHETNHYDLKSNDKNKGKKFRVTMDWVVMGLDDLGHRTPTEEGEMNDLIIAIDNFYDGTSKLRIHYPERYKDLFKKHYGKFGADEDDSLFEVFDEENYVQYIEDIVKSSCL
jgi:hypothetical protein